MGISSLERKLNRDSRWLCQLPLAGYGENQSWWCSCFLRRLTGETALPEDLRTWSPGWLLPHGVSNAYPVAATCSFTWKLQRGDEMAWDTLKNSSYLPQQDFPNWLLLDILSTSFKDVLVSVTWYLFLLWLAIYLNKLAHPKPKLWVEMDQ